MKTLFKKLLTTLFLCIFLIFISCKQENYNKNLQLGENTMETIILKSSSFMHNDIIPKKYSRYGENISPHLQWENIPKNTKSFAIICEDPDAPMKTFVHWVLYNIPSTTTEINEGIPKKDILSDGTMQGTNSFGLIGWDGPQPPFGIHRYIFKIYALDITPTLNPGATKSQLEISMEGHILAQGELIGKYKR